MAWPRKRTVIDQRELLGDGGVQLGEREELPFAQRGQNPAFGDLDASFDRGLILRPIRPGGQNGHASTRAPTPGSWGSAPGSYQHALVTPDFRLSGTTTRADPP